MNQHVAFEDEISLGQLWQIIVRRKKLILAIFVSVFLIGAVIAFFKPNIYNYHRIIMIPSYTEVTENGSFKPAGQQQGILVLLKKQYIPTLLTQYSYTHKDAFIPNISAEAAANYPKIITLSADIPVKYKPELLEFYQKLLNMVIQGQSTVYHNIKQNLLRKQQELEASYADTKIARNGLYQQLKHLGNNAVQLRKEIRNEVDQPSSSDVTTFQANMLFSSIGGLNLALWNLISSGKNLHAQLGQVRDALVNLRKPYFAGEIVRSLKPVKLNKAMLLMLSMILGLMFGMMVAFFFEMSKKSIQI